MDASSLLNPHDTAMVLEEVAEERGRQDQQWGEQNHEGLYWLGILMEEVGEVAKGIIELPEDGDAITTAQIGGIRDELLQVAAVAVAWVEAIDRA